MIRGVNQATFYILPMLADRHPDNYPRFRDCFIGEMSNSKTEKDQFGIPVKIFDYSKKTISLYLKIGNGNRKDFVEEIKELRSFPTYVKDYDDDFDNAYAVFLFTIPEEFKIDFDLILEGKIKQTTKEYRERLYKVFPKLKDKFDSLFN